MTISTTIKEMFSDYKEMKCGTWSDNYFVLQYGDSNHERIEVGLYREPEGDYTLQVFDRDDVVSLHGEVI